jgi:hypothetical protein
MQCCAHQLQRRPDVLHHALLGPLSFHGGPIPVFDPQLDSPTVNAIPSFACGAATDQHGFARPYGPACDIGSVERR